MTLIVGNIYAYDCEGVQVPLRHTGLAPDGFDIGWGIAAPVGHGGFPDAWIAGWQPLPPPPIPETEKNDG